MAEFQNFLSIKLLIELSEIANCPVKIQNSNIKALSLVLQY